MLRLWHILCTLLLLSIKRPTGSISQLDRQMSMMSWSGADLITQNQGIRNYELTNHLGNVLSTITDKGVITSAQDYYPFGLTLASRSFTEGGSVYRFGFNGQEKIPELGGGHTTAEYWEYDARLGRRWNRDPIVLAWQSPYATLDNNPIALSDPSGASTDPEQDPKKTETGPIEKEITLDAVTVTAKRMPLLDRAKACMGRIAEKVKEGYDKINKKIAPCAIAFVSAADACASDLLMKPEPFYKPGDWGNGDYKRIARDGQIFGHSLAVIAGLVEVGTGAGMTGTGGVLTITGVGAPVGVPTAAVGTTVMAHGGAVLSVASANLVKMQMEEADNQAHENHETNGSNQSSGNLSNQIGEDFEKLLVDKFGGTGGFNSGGKQFDGAFEDVWYEAKAGNFWSNVGLKNIDKWKSQFGHYLSIAKANGKRYHVYSQNEIPQIFKDYFRNVQVIKYQILIGFCYEILVLYYCFIP